MNLGKLTYSLLSSNATISGILGAKIFPVQIPQDTEFPAMIYQHREQEPTMMKDGPSPLDTITLSLVFYTKTYADAMTLADASRSTLDRYSGTVVGVRIDSISFIQQDDNDLVEGYGFFVTEQRYKVRMKR